MLAIELLKFCEKIFKSMSEIGVKTDDCRHIGMYDEYKQMESKGLKKEYIRAKIAKKYKVSETSVYRIVNRLDRHVKTMWSQGLRTQHGCKGTWCAV